MESNITALDSATYEEIYSKCSNLTNVDCSKIYELDQSVDQRPFVPSLLVQIIWTVLFSTMVFFASLGNLAVISVILTKRVLRTKINIYLLNLSIADFLMATLNAMFNFISMIKSHWPFGMIWYVLAKKFVVFFVFFFYITFDIF